MMGKVLAVHMTGLDLIPDIPYITLSTEPEAEHSRMCTLSPKNSYVDFVKGS